MDNSIYQQEESDTKRPSSLLASLHIFNDILNWLAGFFHITEEEQRDAGIDLGDQSDR